ncbi:MAG: multicopper polyphenol oxidase [Verrucomicrobiaceae bacterium]|nr:multicopper polyphenol oxidase [Verrucomicrobiaceae bacterium]
MPSSTTQFLKPDWPAPARVAALVTTRLGGVSAEPFDSFNLGDHVGDDVAAVALNRRQLVADCAGLSAVSWLNQVHGTAVVDADAAQLQTADGQFTRQSGLGCAVMTADCLPVLFCAADGSQVAAAHAGWRGLCAGVLEQTVATFGDASHVLAWLGPAIGPVNFEVGAEVREQFIDAAQAQQRDRTDASFAPSARANHFLANIYALATLRLQAVGVTAIFGGGLCTVADPIRFYSFRRDGITGRMASLIYIIGDDDGA